MLSTIMFAIALVTFFAALGRGTMPREERLPLTRWGVRELVANVVLGARRLVRLHERDPRTPPLDELHRPRHGR